MLLYRIAILLVSPSFIEQKEHAKYFSEYLCCCIDTWIINVFLYSVNNDNIPKFLLKFCAQNSTRINIKNEYECRKFLR